MTIAVYRRVVWRAELSVFEEIKLKKKDKKKKTVPLALQNHRQHAASTQV